MLFRHKTENLFGIFTVFPGSLENGFEKLYLDIFHVILFYSCTSSQHMQMASPTHHFVNLLLGKCKGYANPHGSRVSVSPGLGHDSQTHELSNKPKNIFFEAKLKELQLILQNSSKLAVSPSFLGRFGCFWTCFDG